MFAEMIYGPAAPAPTNDGADMDREIGYVLWALAVYFGF